MNKNEYISRLSKVISKYNISSKFEILADYEQIIDEILLDNNDDFNIVIDKLGYPEILALEIVNELGYEIKNNNENKSVQYSNENKRQKSNVIWNILIFIFHMLQVCLAIVFLVFAVLAYYFGIDGKVKVSSIEANNIIVSNIKSCRNNECRLYYSKLNSHKKMPFEINECSTKEKNCLIKNTEESSTFYVGIYFIITLLFISSIIWFIQSVICNGIKKTIKKNNEYNRRRIYE